MGKIRLLDDDVINKIAAGEVVERPSSVVKELVENAIDAGAQNVIINIEDGGKKLIIVTDDGCGMSNEDALKAMERHATSKITEVDDLFSISTMGFRGEALASIASVSRFSLMTQEAETDHGINVQKNVLSDDGSIISKEWSGKRGTSIRVEDLFFNIPARKAFLRSATSEYANILETIHAIAVCNSSIGFSLIHNGKEQFSVPACTSIKPLSDNLYGEKILKDRSKIVFDPQITEQLIYVRQDNKYAEVEMLISAPGLSRGNAKGIYFFVNGRWVKDKVLRAAVFRGYHTHLLSGRYPYVLCFINVDSSLVDVNVSPSKTEVRFQYSKELQDLIATSIRATLRSAEWAMAPLPQASDGSYVIPQRNISTQNSVRHDSGVSFKRTSFEGSSSNYSALENSKQSPSFVPGSEVIPKRMTQPTFFDEFAQFAPAANLTKASSEKSVDWDNLRFLGSFNKCYLMFEQGRNLLVIDQHAFHERILFERLSNDPSLLKSTQSLLVPEAISTSPAEYAILAENKEKFFNLGFSYELLDHNTVEVTQVPALLIKSEIETLITDLISKASFSDLSSVDLAHDLLSTIACHAAVRSGEDLNEQEINTLFSEARSVDFYHNCPHGRRVFKWWSLDEIEGWFDR